MSRPAFVIAILSAHPDYADVASSDGHPMRFERLEAANSNEAMKKRLNDLSGQQIPFVCLTAFAVERLAAFVATGADSDEMRAMAQDSADDATRQRVLEQASGRAGLLS